MFGCESDAIARASRSKRCRVGRGPRSLTATCAVELEVVRDPDLRHAAGAEPLLEAVAARDRLLHDRE